MKLIEFDRRNGETPVWVVPEEIEAIAANPTGGTVIWMKSGTRHFVQAVPHRVIETLKRYSNVSHAVEITTRP